MAHSCSRFVSNLDDHNFANCGRSSLTKANSLVSKWEDATAAHVEERELVRRCTATASSIPDWRARKFRMLLSFCVYVTGDQHGEAPKLICLSSPISGSRTACIRGRNIFRQEGCSMTVAFVEKTEIDGKFGHSESQTIFNSFL